MNILVKYFQYFQYFTVKIKYFLKSIATQKTAISRIFNVRTRAVGELCLDKRCMNKEQIKIKNYYLHFACKPCPGWRNQNIVLNVLMKLMPWDNIRTVNIDSFKKFWDGADVVVTLFEQVILNLWKFSWDLSKHN